MNNHIREIEINFSNACLANCIFCSRPHGVGNIPLMQPETFDVLAKQLKDIDFDIIQTSGNGETFLNPHYLDYVRTLKREFPNVPRWIYNNFSMLDKEKADIIVNENLFSKVNVTVDSLVPWIYERSKNLNFDTFIKNIEYFLSINDSMPFTILYNNVKTYYERCQNVIGKRPLRDHFTDEELVEVKDEFSDIESRFKPLAKTNLQACRVNPCLWGERTQAPKDESAPCPKIQVIEQVIWILPNGDCTACCYDDNQNQFIVGNIHEKHLIDIYNSPERKEFIEGIKARKYTDYPCTNPRCCGFGDGVEDK